MSVFGNIMNKIFHRSKAPQQSAPQPAPAPTASPTVSHPTSAQPAAPTAAAVAPAQAVDVGQVLGEMANMKGGGGNYKTSIVDLLKLLDLDSSLSARKELADELGVHAAEDGSAEQNIALHQAVMHKLAENGGVVPDELRN